MSELRVLTAEPPGEGIAELLELCLREAKASEISSIAIATVDRDGRSQARWSPAPSIVRLIGAVARLEHKLHLECDT